MSGLSDRINELYDEVRLMNPYCVLNSAHYQLSILPSEGKPNHEVNQLRFEIGLIVDVLDYKKLSNTRTFEEYFLKSPRFCTLSLKNLLKARDKYNIDISELIS